LIVVAAVFVLGLPISQSQLKNLLLFLFIMAVLANVAYRACYLVDVAAQVRTFEPLRCDFAGRCLLLAWRLRVC
jgi:hypothetical protein